MRLYGDLRCGGGDSIEAVGDTYKWLSAAQRLPSILILVAFNEKQ